MCTIFHPPRPPSPAARNPFSTVLILRGRTTWGYKWIAFGVVVVEGLSLSLCLDPVLESRFVVFGRGVIGPD